MTKSINKKRFISFCMSLVMLLGSFTTAFANTTDEQKEDEIKNRLAVGDTFTAYGTNSFLGGFYFGSSYDSSKEINTNRLYATINGETVPLYCLNHKKPGPNSSGYEVTVGDNADAFITNIISNGFPNKMPSDMGLNSDDDAYYVTRIAIAMHTNYKDLSMWKITPGGDQAYKQKMLDKAKELSGLISFMPTADEVEKAEISEKEIKLNNIITMENDYYFELTDYEAKKLILIERNIEVAKENIMRDAIPEGAINVREVYPKNNEMQPLIVWDFPDIPEEYGKLSIMKQDGDGNALAGAVFEVKDSNGNPIPESPITIDETGKWTSNELKVGSHTITETKAPAGYQLADPVSQTVDVVADETAVATVTFINRRNDPTPPTTTETPPPTITPTPPSSPPTTPAGEWIVYKLDAKTGKPLAGVTFDVYFEGQLIDSGTTGADGIYKPSITDSGSYTIIERSTNTAYQLTEPTSQVVTVLPGKSTTTTFRDFPSQEVVIYKEDAETGEPVPGCEYEIMQIDGKGAWKSVGRTDSKGQIIWEDVPDGTYMIREVSTVSGYILDQTPQWVTVRNGMSPSLKFLDSKFPGLSIMKIDEQTGVVVTKPATFLVEQIDGTYKEYVTTSGNGTVKLENLPVGSYKITEVSAPEGYILDSEPKTIYLGKDQSIQFIAQNKKAPTVTIEKIDGQTGTAIPGTKFEVRKADGTLVGIATTGADGKVTVGMDGTELGYLEEGVYEITEIFVPEPYIMSGEKQIVELKGGDKKSVTFANLEMPEIVIEKYDEETGEKLPNAQFGIYEEGSTSRPIIEGLTDENGQLSSGKIKPGTYVVKEINPPAGYTFSDKTKPERVVIAKGGDGKIVVKFDNVKLPEIVIEKYDEETGEKLPNAQFLAFMNKMICQDRL